MAALKTLAFPVEYLPISVGAEGPYQEYYRFPENSLYLAGTLIRVYNGSQPTSDDETEHVNLYADHQTGTLDAAGVEKRRVSRSKYGVKRPKAGAKPAGAAPAA